jgi:hypothetical protein
MRHELDEVIGELHAADAAGTGLTAGEVRDILRRVSAYRYRRNDWPPSVEASDRHLDADYRRMVQDPRQ